MDGLAREAALVRDIRTPAHLGTPEHAFLAEVLRSEGGIGGGAEHLVVGQPQGGPEGAAHAEVGWQQAGSPVRLGRVDRPGQVVVRGDRSQPDDSVPEGGKAVQVHLQARHSSLPAGIHLRAGAQLHGVEGPLAKGRKGHMARAEGPGGRQVHLQGPGLARAEGPVHLQALGQQAQLRRFQADVALRQEAAFRDAVLDAVRQEQDAFGLDRPLLQHPHIAGLADTVTPPVEGYAATARLTG